ncbi:MAG: hypothetical protein KDI12_13610 [Anaerolineae bacterium]|nr:hypothetical protein [Anaerolineae bacterium]MCB0236546.1 hypothetical protein [Anaerolineae bacterium]MCB0244446.1 hypothetical protein [Anaerolineae bacterium]MCB9142975.1 hypothetical protein [Anaerolineales bacterium]
MQLASCQRLTQPETQQGPPTPRYQLTTIWQVDARLALIWTALADVERGQAFARADLVELLARQSA